MAHQPARNLLLAALRTGCTETETATETGAVHLKEPPTPSPSHPALATALNRPLPTGHACLKGLATPPQRKLCAASSCRSIFSSWARAAASRESKRAVITSLLPPSSSVPPVPPTAHPLHIFTPVTVRARACQPAPGAHQTPQRAASAPRRIICSGGLAARDTQGTTAPQASCTAHDASKELSQAGLRHPQQACANRSPAQGNAAHTFTPVTAQARACQPAPSAHQTPQRAAGAPRHIIFRPATCQSTVVSAGAQRA